MNMLLVNLGEVQIGLLKSSQDQSLLASVATILREGFRALAGIALGLGLLVGSLSAAPLKVGDTFPSLGQFHLEGYLPETQGKVVLVDFWASWCGPCKKSFPVLNELHKTYGDRGLVIVGVSVDEEKRAMESFLKKTPANFTIVRDAGQKLVAAANVAAMPTSFLIDGQGCVRFLHNGFKGDESRSEYLKEIEELLKRPK